MTQPILEMRGITKTFPGVRALSNVNLSVMPGEIHALVGENGAGKSTLMKVLSGVYPDGSFAGSIVFDGEARRFLDVNDVGVQCVDARQHAQDDEQQVAAPAVPISTRSP